MENLLDQIVYMEKWHGSVQWNRNFTEYSVNEILIRDILSRLGINSGLCVEFGAWNGVKNSNTKKLIDSGWSSIQIEADLMKFQSLKRNYKNNENVKCIQSFVDAHTNLFDDIIGNNPNIDFCSIDIDGLDLDVFGTFSKNLPKIVCIEGGQTLHPFAQRVSSNIAKDNIHQSLSVYENVFSEKGYKLICSYQDSFFVKEEYYDLFNVSENIMDLYLDGILALPRLPFIKQCLVNHGLTNPIVNDILHNCSYIDPQASLPEKSLWVDKNYKIIKNRVSEIRKDYAASS